MEVQSSEFKVDNKNEKSILHNTPILQKYNFGGKIK